MPYANLTVAMKVAIDADRKRQNPTLASIPESKCRHSVWHDGAALRTVHVFRGFQSFRSQKLLDDLLGGLLH